VHPVHRSEIETDKEREREMEREREREREIVECMRKQKVRACYKPFTNSRPGNTKGRKCGRALGVPQSVIMRDYIYICF
jgi:hypothetical protein